MTTKTDKFQKMLNERESEAVEKVEKARTALATEQDRLPGFEEFEEAAEDAVDDLEGKIRGGDTSITGLDLLTARADHEAAQMRVAGSEGRIKRLTTWLGKQNTRRDVAEIVRDLLVQRVVPGAPSYATFNTGGFAKDASKPDSLPALVVTQMEGSVGNDGVGEGRVRIVWHRSPLHARITAEQVRGAFEAAGFTIDPQFGLNNGLTLSSTDDADTAEVKLRQVADRTPLARTSLSSVEGWDESLALELASQDVEAQGVGAQIVSADVDDNGIRTTVVRLSVSVKQTNHTDDINLGQIVKDRVEGKVGKVVRGAGRCLDVKVKQVQYIEPENARSLRSAFVSGGAVYGVEFTHKARAA